MCIRDSFHTSHPQLCGYLRNSKTVSYTHLDVYKRQVLDFQGKPIENKKFNPSETINEENLPYLTHGAFDRFSEFRVGNSFTPVSYTHLDVYKRQE